jgi:serine phosphatase RsbU (regulator of sigma subunit)
LKVSNAKINALIQILIQIGLKNTDSEQIKFQKNFHNILGILMGLGGLLFGGVCAILHLYVVSYIPLIYVGLLIFNFIYFQLSKNFRVASFIQILLTILVPLSFYLTFGQAIPSGMIVLWILLPLVCSIVVVGLKNTVNWFIFVSVFYLFSVFFGDSITSASIDVKQNVVDLFFDLNAIMISGILIGIMVFFIKNREKEHDKLQKLTASLERMVEKRTIQLKENIEELKVTEEELLQNNEELVSLNENIEEQKRKIQKIHDNLNESINVAKTIQEALLTKSELIDTFLGDYFILFEPKDQVSGDFYYLNKTENRLAFTVADCTGHGVPGGFLTALSISYLHEIIRRKDIDKPAQALELLRDRFIELGLGMHFGLDMALCMIDTQTNIMHYSGAFNSLIIIRDNELMEFKADKIPVSFYFIEENFSNQEIELKNNDIIYLFSDGYKDQFGGANNRKFSTKRFKDLLLEIHTKPMCLQKEILINTLSNWKKGLDQLDDITILSIKWEI